jgi:hypothetical protein
MQGRPSNGDRDMTELTAEASGPAMKAAVDHHAAAHPRPHREEHEGLGAPAGAPAPLGQRERVDVVVHEGGRTGHLGEEPGHGNTGELRYMMCLPAHRAGRHIHEAGQPRSHAEEAVLSRGGQRGHLGGEGRIRSIAPPPSGSWVGRPRVTSTRPSSVTRPADMLVPAHVQAEKQTVVETGAAHGPGRG